MPKHTCTALHRGARTKKSRSTFQILEQNTQSCSSSARKQALPEAWLTQLIWWAIGAPTPGEMQAQEMPASGLCHLGAERLIPELELRRPSPGSFLLFLAQPWFLWFAIFMGNLCNLESSGLTVSQLTAESSSVPAFNDYWRPFGWGNPALLEITSLNPLEVSLAGGLAEDPLADGPSKFQTCVLCRGCLPLPPTRQRPIALQDTAVEFLLSMLHAFDPKANHCSSPMPHTGSTETWSSAQGHQTPREFKGTTSPTSRFAHRMHLSG